VAGIHEGVIYILDGVLWAAAGFQVRLVTMRARPSPAPVNHLLIDLSRRELQISGRYRHVHHMRAVWHEDWPSGSSLAQVMSNIHRKIRPACTA
jgi:hypothetical protein